METKLVVGKEYWLNPRKTEKGKLKSVSGDSMDKFVFTFELSNERELSFINMLIPAYAVEVINTKPWYFTTPIAMKCSQGQFDVIKDKLVEMGYEPSFMTFMSGNRYLCTVGARLNNFITDYNKHAVEISPIRRKVFESFNPDLFLVLAAMTDKEDGIKGEWYTDGAGKFCTNADEKDGKWSNEYWRKATAQEIIEHFEKKQNAGSLEFTVKVDIDEEKAAKDLFAKIIEFGKSYMPKYESQSNLLDSIEKKGICSPIKSATEETINQLLNQVESSLNRIIKTRDKEFVLPEKWRLKINPLNECCITNWRNFNMLFKGNCPDSYISETGQGCSNSWGAEITFDQFKKYVLKEPEVTIISIPSGKQAELFDDRVEIKDWRPKEGEWVFSVVFLDGAPDFRKCKFVGEAQDTLMRGKIFKTELEAKLLVEKLKSAML